MKILVCLSQVPDTTTKIKFVEGKEFDKTGVQWIINPWDELALTRAIELKEGSGGKIEKVTIVNVGTKQAEPTIRKGLAIGADNAIRVDTEPKDAFFVASQLEKVIKAGDYDLIFTGIESSDYNTNSVGGILADLLGMNSISAVSGIDFEDDTLKIKRDIDGGYELVNLSTPLIATVQKGIAINPKIPAMRGIMMAKRKPLEVVEAIDIEPLTEFVSYEMPKAKASCKMVETTQELMDLLHNEAKVI